MNDAEARPTTLVLTDVKDENGTMWREVSLTDDGGLVIRGHDVGPGVEQAFGFQEYEFERRLSSTEVSTLRGLLSVSDGDLLDTIRQRFARTNELERFAEEHGIEGEFWSRIGD